MFVDIHHSKLLCVVWEPAARTPQSPPTSRAQNKTQLFPSAGSSVGDRSKWSSLFQSHIVLVLILSPDRCEDVDPKPKPQNHISRPLRSQDNRELILSHRDYIQYVCCTVVWPETWTHSGFIQSTLTNLIYKSLFIYVVFRGSPF